HAGQALRPKLKICRNYPKSRRRPVSFPLECVHLADGTKLARFSARGLVAGALSPAPLQIPAGSADVEFALRGRTVRLTNLRKPLWPHLGVTKRDLLQYYADM